MNFLLTTAVHGIVVDALKHAILAGPTSPDVRSELLAELKAQENSWLPKVLQSERAYAQQTSTDQVHAARGPGGEIAPQLIEWQAKEMSAMDNARKLVDKPWHEVRDQFPPGGNMNAALAAAFRTEARRVMYVRCLQILLALQQYKARTGEDATELKYLGIPDASLIDPFSGNPLHLKSTENGWVVYSVMENGNDDGGNFDDMLDWGLAPPGYDR